MTPSPEPHFVRQMSCPGRRVVAFMGVSLSHNWQCVADDLFTQLVLRAEQLERIEQLKAELHTRRQERISQGTVVTEFNDDTLVSDLDMPIHAFNALLDNGIATVGQLRVVSDAELLCTPNFGDRSLAEVRALVPSASGSMT